MRCANPHRKLEDAATQNLLDKSNLWCFWITLTMVYGCRYPEPHAQYVILLKSISCPYLSSDSLSKLSRYNDEYENISHKVVIATPKLLLHMGYMFLYCWTQFWLSVFQDITFMLSPKGRVGKPLSGKGYELNHSLGLDTFAKSCFNLNFFSTTFTIKSFPFYPLFSKRHRLALGRKQQPYCSDYCTQCVPDCEMQHGWVSQLHATHVTIFFLTHVTIWMSKLALSHRCKCFYVIQVIFITGLLKAK